MEVAKCHIRDLILNEYGDTPFTDVSNEVLNALIDIFAITMKDVHCYDDLTEEQKNYIGFDAFEEMVIYYT